MTRAAPHIKAFNAGEISELVEGRTDIDRYPSSLRKLQNFVLTPQGPAIRRSGSVIVAPVYDSNTVSVLVPFVINDDVAFQLEFSDQRMRVFTDNGILVYAASAAATVTQTSPVKVDSALLAASVGEQIVLTGFAASAQLNGRIGKITAKVGTVYTLDFSETAATGTGTATRVFHLDTTYVSAHVGALRYTQKYDAVYLYCGENYPTRKVTRSGEYSWTIADVDFFDGPYLPVNTLANRWEFSDDGNAIPRMTSNTTPSGTASASSSKAGVSPWEAFGKANSYWQSDTGRRGDLMYEFDDPILADGYSFAYPIGNTDDPTPRDNAPTTWTFEGSDDGITWIVLDEQVDYVSYQTQRTEHFPLKNTRSFTHYMLSITDIIGSGGGVKPRVCRFAITTDTSRTVTVEAQNTNDINFGLGFNSLDIGRLIRVRDRIYSWVPAKITAVADTTNITVKLTKQPLSLNRDKEIRDFRLGVWSKRTGYPTTGAFYEDRFFLGGSRDYPDVLAGSKTGEYENFSQTEKDGVVQDDSALVFTLSGSRQATIRWIRSDETALLVGTAAGEWVISNGRNGDALTAREARGRESSSRGSSGTDPVKVDRQILFVQRAKRTLREMAYTYERDGYASPSLSLFSSHIGRELFQRLDYAAEPYSIVWCQTEAGNLAGLTYNKEEGVLGWHRHTIQGGVVEMISVIPSIDNLQDTLWMVVRRVVNGNQVRYIEKLSQAWDYTSELASAVFVDGALRYSGTETDVLYGLHYLEGETVYGLADGKAVGPLVVTEGSVTLPEPASQVVIGIGYDSYGEISRIEAGAQIGTSQGKIKSINSCKLLVWRSYGGQVGRYIEQRDIADETDQYEWTDLATDFRYDEEEAPRVRTYITEEMALAPAHDTRGSVAFRQPANSPYPFNVVAIMPDMVTYE